MRLRSSISRGGHTCTGPPPPTAFSVLLTESRSSMLLPAPRGARPAIYHLFDLRPGVSAERSDSTVMRFSKPRRASPAAPPDEGVWRLNSLQKFETPFRSGGRVTLTFAAFAWQSGSHSAPAERSSRGFKRAGGGAAGRRRSGRSRGSSEKAQWRTGLLNITETLWDVLT